MPKTKRSRVAPPTAADAAPDVVDEGVDLDLDEELFGEEEEDEGKEVDDGIFDDEFNSRPRKGKDDKWTQRFHEQVAHQRAWYKKGRQISDRCCGLSSQPSLRAFFKR